MNVPNPSVVSLNGLLSAATVNEFAMYVSGLRPVHPLTEYDPLGNGRRVKSQWMVPTEVDCLDGCLTCSMSGTADLIALGRYVA